MEGYVDLVPVGRALLATALGAVLGHERECEGHEAGARTYALVSLGACVFGHISTQGAPSEQTRVAAQVAVGIGFLGGGVIMRGRQHVHGLTTAAAIWTAAAIGLSLAFGTYLLPIAATLIAYGLLRAPHSEPRPRRYPEEKKIPDEEESSEPVAQR